MPPCQRDLEPTLCEIVYIDDRVIHEVTPGIAVTR
jgi:hypothetical protein